MRKIFFLFLLTIIPLFVSAQDIETLIIGEWRIDSVSDNKSLQLNYEEQDDLQKLTKATLVFTADHHARFRLPFSKFNVTNGYWYFDKKNDVIRITKWNDRKTDRIRLWYDILPNDNIKFYFDEKDFSFELYVSKKQ